VRTFRRSLVAAALSLAAACLAEREPLAPSSAKIRLALRVALQGNVAGERIVEIRARFQLANGEQATLPSQPTQVSVADGATVQQPVIIDIGPCNEEAARSENPERGCLFTIELTLKNGAGETLGSAEQGVGPVGSEPTTVPTFVLSSPQLTLAPANMAFGARVREAPPAAQPVTVTATNSGATIGTLTATIAYTSGQGWLQTSIDQNSHTVSVQPTTTALPVGSYDAVVTLTSSVDGMQPQTLAVTYQVALTPVLTITAAGDGSGSVTSAPGGIACTIRSGTTSGSCSAPFEPNATVTLTATASGKDTFNGWGGACSGQTSCTLRMGQALGVSARFNTRPVLQLSPDALAFSGVAGGTSPARKTVTVTNTGSGTLSGVAVSSITPPSPWLDAFVSGTTISVGASPAKLPAGTYTATIGVSSTNGGNDAVRVTFTVTSPAPPPVLTITAAGDGSGSVTSAPAGIACTIRSGTTSGTCSAPFAPNASVTLTATAAGSDVFGGWGGACSGQGSCTLTMKQAVAVSARFNTRPVLQLSPNTLSFSGVSGGASPPQQTVAVVNSGSGTLSGIAIAGISPSSGWLSASFGTSDGGAAAAIIIVSADPARLAAGTYQGTVDVSSTNGGTATLGVTFTVAPPPAQLVVTPDTLTFFTLGEVPATQTVRASNALGSFTDLGPLSVDPATTSWLRVNIDGDIIAVTPDVSKLTVGTWSGRVIINSARGGRAAIRVTLFFSQIG
jgi:hypothetical protein